MLPAAGALLLYRVRHIAHVVDTHSVPGVVGLLQGGARVQLALGERGVALTVVSLIHVDHQEVGGRAAGALHEAKAIMHTGQTPEWAIQALFCRLV